MMWKGYSALLWLFVATFGVVPNILNAQTNKPTPNYTIQKIDSEVTIDGDLNDTCWQNAHVAGEFFQSFPFDTSYATTKTEVKMAYDDQFIYIAATCYDDIVGDYVVTSLRRDFDYGRNDAFAVYIDPFNDRVNGFYFAVNPLGVQAEGLIEGGFRNVSLVWDNRWFSKVKTGDGQWTVEIAIPFKTLRYKEDVSNWGINFSRNDLKRNERSSWSAVPRNFDIGTLNYAGVLNWDKPPKPAGGAVSLIPYTIANVNADYEEDGAPEYGANVGGDAKIAVSSSLNLDLTVNPDFSQVEVDRQQTNLTRFSLFFPEQRQFFVENADLFSQWGFRQIRPFFSRRIGLESGTPIPILGGARLSGKLNPKLRIGVLNMQTAEKVDVEEELDVGAQNYSVAAFQQKVMGESFIGGIIVNRQGFDDGKMVGSDYNRIVGIDYNLVTASNKYRGKAFYHHSFSPNVNSDNYAHATWLMVNTQRIFAMWNHEYVGANYDAQVGFVPRNKQYNPETDSVETIAYWRFEPMINYNMYPKGGPIILHGPRLRFDNYRNKDFKATDVNVRPAYRFDFRNTSNLEFRYNYLFTKLLFETDITFTDNDPIPAGDYEYYNGEIEYNSDRRKKLNGRLTLNWGSYYNGERANVRGELSVRKQPWGVFTLTFSHNQITLPEPYQDADITLIGSRIELSFTKSLFWTTFLQYNTQADNFNVNTRLQWRFRPMSDLYFVYTDNYDPMNIAIKNRAVVLKFIYWLSL